MPTCPTSSRWGWRADAARPGDRRRGTRDRFVVGRSRLAIVRGIVEAHGGDVRAENITGGSGWICRCRAETCHRDDDRSLILSEGRAQYRADDAREIAQASHLRWPEVRAADAAEQDRLVAAAQRRAAIRVSMSFQACGTQSPSESSWTDADRGASRLHSNGVSRAHRMSRTVAGHRSLPDVITVAHDTRKHPGRVVDEDP